MPLAAKPKQEPSGPPGVRRGFAELYSSKGVSHAVSFVDKLGLTIPERPLNTSGQPLEPKLPSDVTRLTPEQLTKLMGEFTAVAAYADAHLGLSDIDHVEYEYSTDVTEATHGLHVEGQNKDERTFQLRLNPSVRRSKEETLARRARKVLLTKLIAGYERAVSVLSRELTRRQVEMQND